MSEYWDKRRKKEEAIKELEEVKKAIETPHCPKCNSKFIYILKDKTLNCRQCGYRGKQKDEI